MERHDEALKWLRFAGLKRKSDLEVGALVASLISERVYGKP